ncbi:endo-beta-N-acetylglucosaminidase D [Bradyrhizobium sp. USDA 326]
MGMAANVGRTAADFQWDLRIVNGLLAHWRHLAAEGAGGTAQSEPSNKKAGVGAGLS